MTKRAVILGLVGALLICALGYYNDAVIRQTALVGNHMPPSVYGTLIVFLVAINPLLFLLRRKWAFTGAELAVVLSITLAACVVPGAGFMRFFSPAVIMPHRVAKTDAGVRDQKVLEMAPEGMLVDIGANENVVLDGYVQGLGSPARSIDAGDVPWGAWTGTLWFWLPIVLLLWFGLIGLAVVLHRQWSDREHLAYPVANFASALLPAEGRPRSGILASRLFWVGAGVVFVIHLNNYLFNWFPTLIQIPTRFDFSSLMDLMGPNRPSYWWTVLRPQIFFTVVAFAYFLASDVSFSMAIGPPVYLVFLGTAYGYGVRMYYGGWFGINLEDCAAFGAFVGLMVTTAYFGRQYYKCVLRRAVFLPARDEVEPQAVWGARVFIVAILAFFVNLMVIGLTWWIAIVFTAVTVMLFTVMSRIMAETGIFFMMSRWDPGAITVTIIGALACGPKGVLILLMLSTIIAVDPRECLMPYVVNSLKLVDSWKTNTGKVALAGGAAILLGLAVAVPVTLYTQYDRGANFTDRFATEAVPTFAVDQTVRYKRQLAMQGTLERSESMGSFARLLAVAPNGGALTAMGMGLALVLLTTVARLRFPKWPLHPVMFLVWGNRVGQVLCGSFLIGWILKASVLKYGGQKVYNDLKPLMYGLVAGDMLAAIVPSIVGAIYYLVTGNPPAPFSILPW